MEGSNVYPDFLPLISGESGTIMICQRSVRSHSTYWSFTDYPERLGQENTEIPTYSVCIRMSRLIATCLGLIIAISLEYFA